MLCFGGNGVHHFLKLQQHSALAISMLNGHPCMFTDFQIGFFFCVKLFNCAIFFFSMHLCLNNVYSHWNILFAVPVFPGIIFRMT